MIFILSIVKETLLISWKVKYCYLINIRREAQVLLLGMSTVINWKTLLLADRPHNPAKIFLQQKNGTFKNDSLQSKEAEDMGLLLFDADQDNDLDLYCVSGSSEFKNRVENYQDRLYRNTGQWKISVRFNSVA